MIKEPKRIILFYKKFKEKQLVKSQEAHNILVIAFLIFTILINLFKIESSFAAILVILLGLVRLVNIHIYNMNVGFFDKYVFKGDNTEIVDSITSFKRVLFLNISVLLEIILWVAKFKFLFILGLISVIPTIYVIGLCIDHYFDNHKDDKVEVKQEIVNIEEKSEKDKIENGKT